MTWVVIRNIINLMADCPWGNSRGWYFLEGLLSQSSCKEQLVDAARRCQDVTGSYQTGRAIQRPGCNSWLCRQTFHCSLICMLHVCISLDWEYQKCKNSSFIKMIYTKHVDILKSITLSKALISYVVKFTIFYKFIHTFCKSLKRDCYIVQCLFILYILTHLRAFLYP